MRDKEKKKKNTLSNLALEMWKRRALWVLGADANEGGGKELVSAFKALL